MTNGTDQVAHKFVQVHKITGLILVVRHEVGDRAEVPAAQSHAQRLGDLFK